MAARPCYDAVMPGPRSKLIGPLIAIAALLAFAGGGWWYYDTFVPRHEHILNAVAAGDVQDVRRFLRSDPELANLQVEDGLTPLLLAVNFEEHDVATLLLEYGADPNARYRDMLTLGLPDLEHNVLMRAVEVSPPNVLELLIERGADVNAHYGEGMTALHVAAASENSHVVQLLIDRGARVDAEMAGTDDTGRNMFRHIRPLHWSIIFDEVETARTLIQAEADVHRLAWSEGEWVTPIEFAVQCNSAGVIILLIDSGVDVNSRLPDGRHLLRWATQGAHSDTVEALISRGADVGIRDADGNTPLDVLLHRARSVTYELVTYYATDLIFQRQDNAPGGARGQLFLTAAAPESFDDVVRMFRALTARGARRSATLNAE